MARLVAVSPMRGLPFPGLRPSQMTRMPLDENGMYKTFRCHVRGPQLFLETPPGYRYGTTPEGVARKVYEVPRAETFLEWELEPGEDVRDLVNWSPPVEHEPAELWPITGPVAPGAVELVSVEPGSPLITVSAVSAATATAVPEAPAAPVADVEEADPDDEDDLPTRTAARKGRRG